MEYVAQCGAATAVVDVYTQDLLVMTHKLIETKLGLIGREATPHARALFAGEHLSNSTIVALAKDFREIRRHRHTVIQRKRSDPTEVLATNVAYELIELILLSSRGSQWTINLQHNEAKRKKLPLVYCTAVGIRFFDDWTQIVDFRRSKPYDTDTFEGNTKGHNVHEPDSPDRLPDRRSESEMRRYSRRQFARQRARQSSSDKPGAQGRALNIVRLRRRNGTPPPRHLGNGYWHSWRLPNLTKRLHDKEEALRDASLHEHAL